MRRPLPDRCVRGRGTPSGVHPWGMHRTGHVGQLEVHSLSRGEVPDRRSLDPGSLLREEEPPGSRARATRRPPPSAARGRPGRPRSHRTGSPAPGAPAGRCPRARSGGCRGGRRRETTRRRPVATRYPTPAGSRVAIDLARRFLPDRDVHAVVVVGREPGGDPAVDQGEAHHPLVVEPAEQRTRLAALEGRHHPPTALVPDLVVPPHDPRAVGQDVRLLGADTARGHPPTLAGADVPRPGLRAAVLGGDRRRPVRRRGRPIHLLDRRVGEAEGPGRACAHGAEDMPPEVPREPPEEMPSVCHSTRRRPLESLALGSPEC